MIYGDGGPVSSEGSLTIPFTQFPSEILQSIIDSDGVIPMLTILLSRVVLPNGLDLNNEDGAMTVKFDFEAFAVEVRRRE